MPRYRDSDHCLPRGWSTVLKLSVSKAFGDTNENDIKDALTRASPEGPSSAHNSTGGDSGPCSCCEGNLEKQREGCGCCGFRLGQQASENQSHERDESEAKTVDSFAAEACASAAQNSDLPDLDRDLGLLGLGASDCRDSSAEQEVVDGGSQRRDEPRDNLPAQQHDETSLVRPVVKALVGGHRWTPAVSVGATVLELKQVVAGAGGPQPEQQRLIFNGRELDDESAPFLALGMSAGGGLHEIFMVRRSVK